MKQRSPFLSRTYWLLALAVATSGVARAQSTSTAWLFSEGDWFAPRNWTQGVPTATLDAQINNGGTANVTASGSSLATKNLEIGVSGAATTVDATGTLTGAGASLFVRGELEVGVSYGPAGGNGTLRFSGKGGQIATQSGVSIGVGQTTLPVLPDAKVVGSLIHDGSLSGSLLTSPTAPHNADLNVGVGSSGHDVVGTLVTTGAISGFDDVSVGWSQWSPGGSAVGSLSTSRLTAHEVGNAGTVLRVGVSESGGGFANGTLSVTGDISQFQQVIVGNAYGDGPAWGSLTLKNGTLSAASIVDIGTGNRSTSTAQLVLDNAHVAVTSGPVQIGPSGSLFGTGSVQTSLFNAGRFDVGGNLVTQFDVRDTYSQPATGRLVLDIPSLSVNSADRLDVGSASLDGTLHLRFADDVIPTLTDQVILMASAGPISGQFTSLFIENPPSHLAVVPAYGTDVSVRFAATQSNNYLPSPIRNVWSDPNLWSQRQAPSETSIVSLHNTLTTAANVRLTGTNIVHQTTLSGKSREMLLDIGTTGILSSVHGIEIQDLGHLNVDGAVFASEVAISARGQLSGQGTITGRLVNGGVLQVGDNVPSTTQTLDLVGDLYHNSDAEIRIDVTSSGIADLITVEGDALLMGNLAMTIDPALVLGPGEGIEVMRLRGEIVEMSDNFRAEYINGQVYVVNPHFNPQLGFTTFNAVPTELFDLNLNGETDPCDIDVFADLLITGTRSVDNIWRNGDANKDNVLDFLDIDDFLQIQFNGSCPFVIAPFALSPAAQSLRDDLISQLVPEPAVVNVWGLFCVVVIRRLGCRVWRSQATFRAAHGRMS